MDTIFIQQLHTQAVIGVYDFEKVAPQSLIFDLEMGVDIERSMRSDDLNDTVDYAAVAAFIRAWLQQHQFELLEAMMSALFQALWAEFLAIQTLKIRVYKPQAVEQAVVGIEMFRQRPALA